MAITDETYVLLTSFRKNGDGVGTAVWIAALADGAAGFTTEVDSGKVKRIRNNPEVTLQPCDVRGRVREGAAIVHATAEVLVGEDARPVRDAIHRKHSLMTKLLGAGGLWRRLLRRPAPIECAIRLRVH